jgi:hypothetical protein
MKIKTSILILVIIIGITFALIGKSFAIPILTFSSSINEPVTMLLLGAGFLGLAGLGRMKLIKK